MYSSVAKFNNAFWLVLLNTRTDYALPSDKYSTALRSSFQHLETHRTVRQAKILQKVKVKIYDRTLAVE